MFTQTHVALGSPRQSISRPFTVIATSRSQPASHQIHSQPTLTAIVRSPSSNPLVLDPEHGIQGHRSAVHDAQIYAFFAQHYDYWASRLNIDRGEWDWAHWGENLTLSLPEGVDETTIMVGDRWVFTSNETIGHGGIQSSNSALTQERTAVILEVCGGRNPCSRLAWRCGQPGSWLAEVAKTGFCGVYLKVIHGGTIATGDTASIVQCCDENTVPVASIAQCAFSPLAEPATRELAQRILRVPGLQNMNRQVIERKLGLIEEAMALKQNRWSGWRRLRVSKIVVESLYAKSFYLTAVDEKPLATYVPGQFLTIKLASDQIRCWSISSWSPSETTAIPPYYRITVREGASASRYLHSQITIGDTLLARSPSGTFVPDWSREFPPRQIYISAGIGATPVLSMLQGHLAHTTLSKTPAFLIHVARNGKEDLLMYERELKSSKLLRTIKFYTAPLDGGDIQGQHFDYEGRPTLEFFSGLLREPYHIDPLGIVPIELPGNASSAYICGPPTFVNTIRNFLEQCNIPPQAIRFETFNYDSAFPILTNGVSPTDPFNEDVPESALVQFHGQKVKWEKIEGLSLLKLIERDGRGKKPESGCRMGDCGTCEVKILKGEVRVLKTAGKEAQEASGKPGSMVRSCCSHPLSKLLELEF